MRMFVKLTAEDPPEFDSFASLLVTLKGAKWSLQNTSLSESMTMEQESELFNLMESMGELIEPLAQAEIAELAAAREEEIRMSMGLRAVTDPPLSSRTTVQKVTHDGEPVARVRLLDAAASESGVGAAFDLPHSSALQLAMQLLNFVQMQGATSSR